MQLRRFLVGVAIRVLPDRIIRVLRAMLAAWRDTSRRPPSPIPPIFAHAPPTALPASVLAQIREQGDIDPAVLAPGINAIQSLRQISAIDLATRNGADADAVLSCLDERPSALILLPMLCNEGAEKYAADIAEAVSQSKPGRVLVIVTDQSAAEAAGWERYAILHPLRRCKIVFWRDISNGPGGHSPVLMALFLNALRPPLIFIIESRIGLETTAHFGRGLARHSRVFCAFFGLGRDALSAPYGVRFARTTRPHATLLTDNTYTAKKLRQRYHMASGPGIEVLPASLRPCSSAVFASRLSARSKRSQDHRSPRRWAWMSRIEPWKGTAVLAEIAKLRPHERFDLFGPLQNSMRDLGLRLPNVFHRGILSDLATADFSTYEGLLFTSFYEGMPNVVLEISQHALPMILADVGGLRDTFSERSVIYVQHAEETHATAAAFAAAMTRVSSLAAKDIETMVASAKREADTRHAPSAYLRRINELIDEQQEYEMERSAG